MKVVELVKLIGVLEPVRILNHDFDDIEKALVKDLSKDVLDKNIKALFADQSSVCIVIK